MVSPLVKAPDILADNADKRATNPSSGAESAQQIIANFENVSGGSGSGDNESYEDAEDTPEIKAAKQKQLDPDDFTYTERDVMLYNLGVGAKADELHLTYENADGFAVSPGVTDFHHLLMSSHYQHSVSFPSSVLHLDYHSIRSCPTSAP